MLDGVYCTLLMSVVRPKLLAKVYDQAFLLVDELLD